MLAWYKNDGQISLLGQIKRGKAVNIWSKKSEINENVTIQTNIIKTLQYFPCSVSTFFKYKYLIFWYTFSNLVLDSFSYRLRSQCKILYKVDNEEYCILWVLCNYEYYNMYNLFDPCGRPLPRTAGPYAMRKL